MCGIVVNSVEIYTQVLYFAIEMQNRFENISVQHPTVFTLTLVLYNLLRLVVPLIILGHEVKAVVTAVSRSARDGRKKQQHALEKVGSDAREKHSAGFSNSVGDSSDINWAKYLNMRKRRNSIDPSDVV